jgi:hypothetical protein
VAMSRWLRVVACFWLVGCGSGAASSSTSPADASSSDDVGACIQVDSAGSVRACTEYLPGNQAVIPAARSGCTGTNSGYTQQWASACPPEPVNGCQYPPGVFGVPGGQIVWYYQSAGGCTSEGTLIHPDGTPLVDAATTD